MMRPELGDPNDPYGLVGATTSLVIWPRFDSDALLFGAAKFVWLKILNACTSYLRAKRSVSRKFLNRPKSNRS